MTTLSTHVLDAAVGRPAVGLDVTLAASDGGFIAAATTDDDGRIAWTDDLDPGAYVLTFATGEWFAAADRPTFFPTVTLAATLEGDHTHVALLLSPYSYTTYKGVLMAAGDIILGDNQYGKAEVRLVRVARDTERHEIEDLNVTSQLRGDFTACFTDGDNAQVVATDTQKNTVYAYAKEHGIGSPEQFLVTLGRHFVDDVEWVTGGRWEAEQYTWQRITVDGRPHDHAFVRASQETRTAVVQIDGDTTHVVAGLTDCTVLKSTGSEFHGFPRDRYTTLGETDDRILATSVTAWWRYTDLPDDLSTYDFNGTYAAIRDLMLETFASFHSLALQQTLFQMGSAVLEAFGSVAEIKFSMPNKHHFVVDLAPFGLDNPNEVFFAADRPYGLIEAVVQREGAVPAPAAWATIPGFA